MVVGAQVVGAAVGARHAGEDLGAPMTARAESRARGTARFFAVLTGAAALFCGVELIEWTTVEVCVMVDDRRVARSENTGTRLHCTPSMQVKCHSADAVADAITKTTT